MIQPAKRTVFSVASRLGTCPIQDTIVVAGTPRSGTTWLLELLRSLSGYKALNEPLLYEEARAEYGFSWRTYLSPDDPAPKQSAYMQTILSGRLGLSPAWHFEDRSRIQQLVTQATRRRLVVKFCRANRMLHWLVRRFDVRGLVFIVRHPCAVVASMLRHGGWEHMKTDIGESVDFDLDPALPSPVREHFSSIVRNCTSRTEALAALWCLDHYIPLVYHTEEESPWVLVPYERLVTEGHSELQRIVSALGTEMTVEMRGRFDEPSSSVRDQFHQNAEQQLSKWRRRLSDRQVDEVLSIVQAAGLDAAYSRDLEPNYDWLCGRQHPKWRW